MSIKELVKQKKYIVIYSIIMFIVLSSTYLMMSILLHINSTEVKKSEISKNEQRLVETEKNILSNKIYGLISDLLYISDDLKAHGFEDNEFQNIEVEWKDFADRKNVYNQIRYIDINGYERIRINHLDNSSIVVKKSKQQSKKDRYYFKETIQLKENQVYISKMDLNIEKGKIEEPIKPMIRLSTPIFGKNKELKGIVIMNYYAKNLLQDFEKIGLTSSGNMFLLDSNGYWIYNAQNREKQWTFMYQNKKNISFKSEFPKEWNSIKQKKKGTIITENGYYIYENIIPCVESLSDRIGTNSIVLGEGNWIAVSFIPKDNKIGEIFFMNLYKSFFSILKSRKVIFILIFATSISLSILIIINKISKQKIKYFSEYDIMTGTFNRRAGFELLDTRYLDVMKKDGKISICFVDINGLKEVNDNLGHKAGDELILTIVKVIKKHKREKDFVMRLGGDEFLIIFIDVNAKQAEIIWSRINDQFKEINEKENRRYVVSVSHGIEQLKSNQNMDDIINKADEKMYIEKHILKKDLKIVRRKVKD